MDGNWSDKRDICDISRVPHHFPAAKSSQRLSDASASTQPENDSISRLLSEQAKAIQTNLPLFYETTCSHLMFVTVSV